MIVESRGAMESEEKRERRLGRPEDTGLYERLLRGRSWTNVCDSGDIVPGSSESGNLCVHETRFRRFTGPMGSVFNSPQLTWFRHWRSRAQTMGLNKMRRRFARAVIERFNKPKNAEGAPNSTTAESVEYLETCGSNPSAQRDVIMNPALKEE
ncbi:hypothetical protein B0H19DRAFT_1079494 [Mycena capillaripes]|nr:hypothetical protein B0H19DRAFT_1079494 [Mycena capillaripes]